MVRHEADQRRWILKMVLVAGIASLPILLWGLWGPASDLDTNGAVQGVPSPASRVAEAEPPPTAPPAPPAPSAVLPSPPPTPVPEGRPRSTTIRSPTALASRPVAAPREVSSSTQAELVEVEEAVTELDRLLEDAVACGVTQAGSRSVEEATLAAERARDFLALEDPRLVPAIWPLVESFEAPLREALDARGCAD